MTETNGPTYTELYCALLIRQRRLAGLWRELAEHMAIDYDELLVREVMADPKARDAVREALGNWDRSAERATGQAKPAASTRAPEAR